MAVLADSKNSAVAKLDELLEAARTRNIELSIHRVDRGDEIAAAIDAKSPDAMALNVLSSLMLFSDRQLIMDHVAALRLPAIHQWP
jgi:putative tryptophan/tyrosine transport system substrate-binding protein